MSFICNVLFVELSCNDESLSTRTVLVVSVADCSLHSLLLTSALKYKILRLSRQQQFQYYNRNSTHNFLAEITIMSKVQNHITIHKFVTLIVTRERKTTYNEKN